MNREAYFAALVLCFILISGLEISGIRSVGICYGSIGSDLPSPADVVALYKANNIRKMRIYYPNQATLQALRGSNIEVILGVPNDKLKELASSANAWIQTNVVAYPNVNFKYIAVGNEVHPGDRNAPYVLPAMQNVQKAINIANLGGKVKVSTAIDTSLLGVSYPPSAGSFSDSANSYISPIISFLVNNGSPLLANIYPYFSYVGNLLSISLPDALFISQGTMVNDGQYQYQNLFDALLDSIYAALEKAGGLSLQIVVSESGWPSDGGTVATVENARTYYENLIGHVGKGTPRKPGQAIDAYLFAMFDENQKPGDEIEKHFGLFSSNQQQKYQLTFESQIASIRYDRYGTPANTINSISSAPRGYLTQALLCLS